LVIAYNVKEQSKYGLIAHSMKKKIIIELSVTCDSLVPVSNKTTYPNFALIPKILHRKSKVLKTYAHR
jgi:hypothetical protein